MYLKIQVVGKDQCSKFLFSKHFFFYNYLSSDLALHYSTSVLHKGI